MIIIKIKRKKLGSNSTFKDPNKRDLVHGEPIKLYNKKVNNPILKNKFYIVMAFILSLTCEIMQVKAVDKIEGGNVTIDSLGTTIKALAFKFQILGIILAFGALVVFTGQFIIGDDETKQRRKKTILYTLGGVALLILIPSIINFIIDTIG